MQAKSRAAESEDETDTVALSWGRTLFRFIPIAEMITKKTSIPNCEE